MKVDIWSDTRCPFCFVGKRNFENALAKFPEADNIEINWHSFQLDPNIVTQPEKDPYEFLAEIKGLSLEQIKGMHEHLMQSGKAVGIDFNFDESKVANSFRSQMLLQLAKTKGKANEMEELLFEAQFLNGQNVDDPAVLVELGEKLGISKEEVLLGIESDDFKFAVNQDIQMANNLGIRGVPFFIFNDKYAVSGAQPEALFLEVLEKSYNEYKAGDSGLKIINEGDSCDVDGNCN